MFPSFCFFTSREYPSIFDTTSDSLLKIALQRVWIFKNPRVYLPIYPLERLCQLKLSSEFLEGPLYPHIHQCGTDYYHKKSSLIGQAKPLTLISVIVSEVRLFSICSVICISSMNCCFYQLFFFFKKD